MRNKLMVLFCMMLILSCELFINYTELATAAENTEIKSEQIITSADEDIIYPEELQAYVQDIVDNTDPLLLVADPQMDDLKQSLFDLKQVHPQKSYDELLELLGTVEDENDYNRLIGNEDNMSINDTASLGTASTLTTSTTPTSTNSVLDAEDQNLWKNTKLYNCIEDYSKYTQNYETEFGEMILEASESFIIPGLGNTNVSGSSCTHMVPQGICKVDNYILISAYCSEKEHYSVIYVLSESTKEYQCTLQTYLIAHVGGIVYDGTKYLWVCYARDDKDIQEMQAYDMSDLSTYIIEAKKTQHKTKIIEWTARQAIDVKPSFCTYFEGMLWVGEFHSSLNKTAVCYATDGTKLTKGAEIQVPPKSQGMAFCRYGGKVYCSYTTSYKRVKESILHTYTIDDYGNKEVQNHTLKYSEVKTITMPSMMEGICRSGYYVYSIFESAAKLYRNGDGEGYSVNPCDRICKFYPSDIFYK